MPESKMEMKVEETPMDAGDDEETQSKQHLDWNVDMEVQLFYAMRGHKPVGVNRHFQMVCIHEKFKNSVQMDVTSQQIWDHLDTMYDMAALHESEIVPFPNEVTDFSLPDTDFDKQIEEKLQHAGSTDKTSRDDAVVATAGRATKDSDDKGDADKVTPKVTSSVGHKSTKESSTKKSTSSKESRASAASVTTATPTTPINTTGSDAADGSSHADSGSHLKRKRNTRLQQEQQSASKPSSPASGSSSSKAKNKKTR